LNYITLKIRDKKMKEMLDEALVKKWESIYWPMIIVVSLGLLFNIYNLLNKSSQSVPQMFLQIFLIGVNVGFWTIIRYWRIIKKQRPFKYTSIIIIIFYATIVTVYVNLAMRNLLPPGFPVDMNNLEFF